MTTGKRGRGKTKPTPTICGADVVPEVWSWQMAQEALAKNNSNRNLRMARVEQYMRSMVDKLWGAKEAKLQYRAAAGFIVYDWDGNLIDGQHRLHAQVQSRTTQRWYVLRDVPPSTQNQIDTGIARTAADALKFEGYANYIILASVARWAWLLEQGAATGKKIKVSNEEILDMVERHPDLAHSAEMGAYAARSGMLQKVFPPSPLGAAHWWIAQEAGHVEADMFLDRIAHLHREREGSALLALVNRFSTAAKNNEHLQTQVQIAMFLKAWNLDVERSYVQKIAARSRTGELVMPKVASRIISQEDAFGPLSDAEYESGEYEDLKSDTEDEEQTEDEQAESEGAEVIDHPKAS